MTADIALPFFVVCQRQDGGRERTWNAYATEEEAQAVAARLREVGCPARVVPADELTP